MFDQTSTEFLRFTLSLEGIKMNPCKIKAVLDWGTPCNVCDLQRLLGFAHFYQKFISNFSKQTKPLTALFQKNTQFHCLPKAQHSFKQLKLAFTSAPVLGHPDIMQVFIVEANTSSTVIEQSSPRGIDPSNYCTPSPTR